MTNLQSNQHQSKFYKQPLTFLTQRKRRKQLQIGGRMGSLEVRLIESAKELRQVQNLRYQIFYQEMTARANTKNRFFRRDEDRFDKICDHLLVLDHSLSSNKPKIVGTYRLLRQEIAKLNRGFYTQNEYDVMPLIESHKSLQFLELGRSCVLEPYRTKRTVELLWHGIWSYVLAYDFDVMFGCASFPGTNPKAHAMALSFLHHFATADGEWAAQALQTRYISMNMLEKAAVSQKEALKTIPPLIKGYLRLGAKIGDGAVIDRQFGTTDVLIILPVSHIEQRYIKHYGSDAQRFTRF